jgi:transcriptional regulator with XRE-family HTH domain
VLVDRQRAKDERVLPEDESKRRIAAARMLRGVTQKQLAKMGSDYGLGKQELGRAERGELPVGLAKADALSRLLRFPPEWFLAENIDDLIRWPVEGEAQLKRAAEILAPQLLAAVQALPTSSGTALRAPAEPDRPAGGTGGESK